MARLETGLEKFKENPAALFGDLNPFALAVDDVEESWYERIKGVLERIVPALIPVIETIFGEGNGGDKKDALLDGIEVLYRESGLDVPWCPMRFEIIGVRWIAGKVIDKVVSMMNIDGFLKD